MVDHQHLPTPTDPPEHSRHPPPRKITRPANISRFCLSVFLKNQSKLRVAQRATYTAYTCRRLSFGNFRRSPIFYVILTALCTLQFDLSMHIVYHKMSRKLMGPPTVMATRTQRYMRLK